MFRWPQTLIGVLGLGVSTVPVSPAATGTISVAPGTVVRWSAPRTTFCAMGGRTWRAIQETCYYPIDLLRKPGVLLVSRWGAGGRQYARITDFPVAVGSPVLAVADGIVVLVRDLFFPGQAVFIDHGNGLVSMYFHLAEFNVREGEEYGKVI